MKLHPMTVYNIMQYLFLLLLVVAQQLYAQNASGNAKWITNTEDTAAHGTPCFRKSFGVKGQVKKATLRICGVGYHITTVNGKQVTDGVLEQGYTRFDKRLLYTTYDVSALLHQGENCLAAELGNGFYNVQNSTIWFFDRIGWRNTPRMMARLRIDYLNGKSEWVDTDSSWRFKIGPGIVNGMYAGEIYDAREEIPGWNKPDFDDDAWGRVLVTQSPGGALFPQEMPSVKVIEKIKPAALKQLDKRRWLFNMGQNFAGVVTIRVQGNAGDSVIMRFGEVLNKDGSLNREHNAGQMLLKPGDLTFQTDIYVLKGGGRETYTPRFTYHGFQYVEVEAPEGMQLSNESVTGLFYSTDFRRVGKFSSSDTMLNRLYDAAIRSYRSNFISIPTDCPQREKNGWTADAHLAAELGLWNFDAASGYRKWLGDLRDVQLPDGNLPGIAPTNGRGYHWTDRNDDGFGPAWASALPLITWYLYLYTGDTTAIKENYEAIQLYEERMRRRAEGYIYNTGFGDWVYLQPTPVPFVSTAYFYTDTRLLEKMAGVLGKKAEATAYGRLADSIRTAFNDTFLHHTNSWYGDTALTALSGAIFHGLCPDSLRQQVADRLAAGVIKRNYHCDFGVLGTKYVLPVLSQYGHADVAYRLLTDTGYAGWGHWIANGATTLYEDWPGAESHNHVFFGDFAGPFFYQYLAGIRPDEQSPGFKHFFIHPVFPEGLQWITAEHNTRYGEIRVAWKRKGNNVDITVDVPQGTTAHVTLPGYERMLNGGRHNWLLRL